MAEETVAEIVDQVLARWKAEGRLGHRGQIDSQHQDGVFPTVDEAVHAAAEAQKRVAAASLDDRGRMVEIIRRLCVDRAAEWARVELEETGLGRLDHKIEKLKAIPYVLGVEAMRTEARSDSTGLCVIERAPWGVIGMVLPVTHSVPTMASNAINVIAAGNTAVFSPHPSGAKSAAFALQVIHHEIARELGISNVITGGERVLLLIADWALPSLCQIAIGGALRII